MVGSEGSKLYLGDPYEGVMNALYTAYACLAEGDEGNARAALKSGILTDSDSGKDEYRSDVAGLFLLEAWLALRNGQSDLARQDLEKVQELLPDCPLADPDLRTLPTRGWDVRSLRGLGAPSGLLLGAGLVGGAAQIFLTSGYRCAEAGVLAPFDYVSMIFSLLIGWFIFAEAPTWGMLAGATLIIGSGITIIWRERQLGVRRSKARANLTPQG